MISEVVLAAYYGMAHSDAVVENQLPHLTFTRVCAGKLHWPRRSYIPSGCAQKKQVAYTPVPRRGGNQSPRGVRNGIRAPDEPCPQVRYASLLSMDIPLVFTDLIIFSRTRTARKNVSGTWTCSPLPALLPCSAD